MLVGHRDFREVIVADSEFRQPEGERPRPMVEVARELVSGCTYRMFGEDLLSRRHPPYPIGPDCLFVAFHAPAEISVHHALGWEDPVNVLDLHVEFRNFTNGRYLPSGSGLIGALVYCGLEAMNPVEKTKKDEGRELAMSDRVHTAEEWQHLFHGRGYRQTISVATGSQWTRTRFASGRGSTRPLRLSTNSARCWEKCASTVSRSVPTDATALACGHSLRAPAATSHVAASTLWGHRFGCADSFARSRGTLSFIWTIASRSSVLQRHSRATQQ